MDTIQHLIGMKFYVKKSKDMVKPEKSKNQVVPYMNGHLVLFTQ